MPEDIKEYLQSDIIKKTLGAAVSNYTSCSDEIILDFGATLDAERRTPYYVTGLLERGVKVLLYVGESTTAFDRSVWAVRSQDLNFRNIRLDM